MKNWKVIPISLAVMGAASGLILVIAALVLSKTQSLPQEILPVLTTVLGCIPVFLGGFFASRYEKKNGLLIGVASGILFTLICAVLSLFSFQKELEPASAAKGAAFLLSGCIGGILGVNGKRKIKF